MALFSFEDFNKKAEAKDEHEEKTDEFSLFEQIGSLKREAPEKKENEKIKKGFVENYRVARDWIGVICWMHKNDCPGKICWSSQNFLVDEVTNPDKTRCKGGWYADKIEEADPGQLGEFGAVAVAK